MATYQELTAQYEAMQDWNLKVKFQVNHPNWWKNYKEKTGTGDGGGTTSQPDMVFDPATGTWVPSNPFIQTPGTSHPETTLVYDPTTGKWIKVPWGQALGAPEETEEETDGLEFIGLTPDGNREIWRDPETGAVTYKDTAQGQANKAKHENDVFALYRDTLEQFGFSGTDVEDFLKQSVREDWNASTFTIKMRQQKWYLDNPLYAANIARSNAGKRFLNEAQVLSYAADIRDLARSFGYHDVPDAYIASALVNKDSDPSTALAQMHHVLTVQQKVNQYGGGVALVYREVYGHDPSDQDLFDIFDPAKDTKDVDDALRQAEYRGRPLTLGLGIRSEAEARAFEMMGVSPDEAFKRYEGLAANATTFDRLRSVEDLITQGLPEDFGKDLAARTENSLLARAWLFKNPEAQAEWDQMVMREIARFKQSGAPVSAGGQAVGLLSPTERASFG